MSDEVCRLWTIQSPRCVEEIAARGVLRADGRRADRDFREAYRWMMGQMRARLPNYRGRFPVWAWFSPKPDLRRSVYGGRGERCVRIECCVPASRVLLSDYEAWNAVLSDDYLALSEAEQDDYYARADAAASDAARYVQIEEEKRRSWDRVFNLSLLREHRSSAWTGCGLYVQACVEEIYAHEIVRVSHFVSR